jgi:hypothetical protein
MSRKIYTADKRLPSFTETEATLSFDIVRVEFSFNGHPDTAVERMAPLWN